MSKFNFTGLECVSCRHRLESDFSGYVCPRCGNNLRVLYDLDRVKAWREAGKFPARGRTDLLRYGAVLPVAEERFYPDLRVGGTPLYERAAMARELGLGALYLKDDGLNPSGSLKDRASAAVVAVAAVRGVRLVAAASTGNAGSSMACMAAAAGLSSIIMVPQSAPPAKIAQLLVFGAQVVAVKGSYDDAFDLCLRLSERHGWFNRNTGYNPFTREGKKTVIYEVVEQLEGAAPDWVVVPVGDGNIISAVGKGLREMQQIGMIRRLPRLLAAQAATSDAISRTVAAARSRNFSGDELDRNLPSLIQTVRGAHTVADSICVDLPRDGVAAVWEILHSQGEAVTATDEEILQAVAELGRKAAVFVEPAAAVTWAALRKAVAAGIVEKGARVVCLLTGSGLKDISAAQKAAGSPLVVPPDEAAVEEALGLAGRP